MIIVVIVCLFSDIMFRPGEAYGYTEKTGVVDVDADSYLNVRNGVGTSGTSVIQKLKDGTIVTIIDEAKASDGALWYKIVYQGVTGYAISTYITNVQDKIDYTEDADFEAYLNAQGFPESYKDALRQLHAKYPKWVFVADHLEYTWDTALTNQNVTGRSLIAKDSISSWKSLESNAYNWDTGTWYTFDGGKWCAASKELIAYYMDPRNFLNDKYIWMFEQLSYQSSFQTIDKLEQILVGTFMEAGKNTVINDETGAAQNYADIIMIAAAKSGVNPYHLASSIRIELGSKTPSSIISGTVAGYEGLYNYYNWGAYAHDGRGAVENGLIYAGKTDAASMRPWNTRYKAIIGGAIKVGTGYINIGQDTLYYKKFDYVGTPYTHQYMTHIKAHESEALSTSKAYSDDVKSNSSIVFKIPVYKNMPETAAIKPTGDGSPNNCLSSLSINDFSLTPTFSKFTTEYTMIVDKSVASVEVNATPIINSTKVTGTGAYELKDGSNTIQVVATAENGAARTYTITIVRQDVPTGGGTGETTTPGESGSTSGGESSGENGSESGSSSGETTPPTTEAPTEPPTPAFSMSTTLNTNSNNTVTGIKPGATVAEVISTVSVTGGTVVVLDANEKIKTDGKICTGDMVAGMDLSGNYVSVYTVVLYGDVNGDGDITIKDLLVLRKYLLGTTTLEGAYLQAGNTNKDQNGATIKDILVLRKQLLGSATIEQN